MMEPQWTLRELAQEACACVMLTVAAWFITLGTWLGVNGERIHERLYARHHP